MFWVFVVELPEAFEHGSGVETEPTAQIEYGDYVCRVRKSRPSFPGTPFLASDGNLPCNPTP
jgi:hypothetical protein